MSNQQHPLAFLFNCIEASGCRIDFNAVGKANNLSPGAARMRYKRLKKSMRAGTFSEHNRFGTRVATKSMPRSLSKSQRSKDSKKRKIDDMDTEPPSTNEEESEQDKVEVCEESLSKRPKRGKQINYKTFFDEGYKEKFGFSSSTSPSEAEDDDQFSDASTSLTPFKPTKTRSSNNHKSSRHLASFLKARHSGLTLNELLAKVPPSSTATMGELVHGTVESSSSVGSGEIQVTSSQTSELAGTHVQEQHHHSDVVSSDEDPDDQIRTELSSFSSGMKLKFRNVNHSSNQLQRELGDYQRRPSNDIKPNNYSTKTKNAARSDTMATVATATSANKEADHVGVASGSVVSQEDSNMTHPKDLGQSRTHIIPGFFSRLMFWK